MRSGIDDTDVAGALRILPYDGEIGYQLDCNIVHHQGKEGLIGAKLSLEECRDSAPNSAGQKTGDHHTGNDHPIWLILHQDHTSSCGKRAGKGLTFTADVPKAHLKGGGQSKGNAEQHSGVLQKHHKLAAGAERTVDDGGIDLNRVFRGHKSADDTAANQGKRNGSSSDTPGKMPGHVAAFYNMKKRLFYLIHCCFLQDGSSSCRHSASRHLCRERCRLPCLRKVPGCGHKVPEEHQGLHLHK